MKSLKKIENELLKIKKENTFFDHLMFGVNQDHYFFSYSFALKAYNYTFNDFEMIEDTFELSKNLLKEEHLSLNHDMEYYTNEHDKVKEVVSLDNVCHFVFKTYAEKRNSLLKNHFKNEYENTGDVKASMNGFVDTFVSNFKDMQVEKSGRTISVENKDFRVSMYIDVDKGYVTKNNEEKYEINIENSFDALEHIFNEINESIISKSLDNKEILKKTIKRKNKLH